MGRWCGSAMLLRLAIIVMMALSLAMLGCSSDDNDIPDSEFVDVDAVLTGDAADPIPAVLDGHSFDGTGSQFGRPDVDMVRITFVTYDAATNTSSYVADEIEEDDVVQGQTNVVGRVVNNGVVSWDTPAGTGRCDFDNTDGVVFGDGTVNQCTVTATSDQICLLGTTCAGEITIDADALDDSSDADVTLELDGDVIVNGVNMGEN